MATKKSSRDLKSISGKLLFTPGPLSTSQTVKEAMLTDFGSRDQNFIAIIAEIRKKLLAIARVDDKRYSAVLMQGSGTFAIESVIASTIPPDGKLFVIINGAYGRRVLKMANILGINTTALEWSEDQYPRFSDIEKKLADDSQISHVMIIHCETTTGIINPIQKIGRLVYKYKRHYIVDAMSSFGAVPIDMHTCHIHYLISSANKCLHGVPGFSLIIADIMSLIETEGYARSLSLNLLEQYRDLEKNGQFRFTPPTHALVAFRQALIEFEEQGNVQGRARRYKANFEALRQGMRRLGFTEFLPAQKQSYIISTFLYPNHPNFKFETLYSMLNEKGFVIYPGKLGQVECFRIGTIGEIGVTDIKKLLVVIENTLKEMKINLTKET